MIILASASPRRKELLGNICQFEVRVASCDENCALSDPESFVCELSCRKAYAVSASDTDTVIGADTVVAADGHILGKPHSKEEAFDMLKMLSGKTHKVYTGVTVKKGAKSETFCECTDVTFFPLSDKEINDYIATDEPFDKAGAYGIQGKGCVLVKGINGDYFNVVGLPVARLSRVLKVFEGEDTGA